MLQDRYIPLIIISLILLSGCIEDKDTAEVPTTVLETPVVTETVVPTVTVTPGAEVTPTGNSTPVNLDIRRGFIPSSRVIVVGDEIVWENDEVETVTLVSDDGLFEPHLLSYGKRYSHVFTDIGTYSFHLEGDENLNGTVIVGTSVPATPQAETPVELLPRALYVTARMLKPVDWGDGKYELVSLKTQITNQQKTPLSIKAQIMSGDSILEERSFVLESEGSVYSFVNEKRHFINDTNLTLRLWVQDDELLEYPYKLVTRL